MIDSMAWTLGWYCGKKLMCGKNMHRGKRMNKEDMDPSCSEGLNNVMGVKNWMIKAKRTDSLRLILREAMKCDK